MLLKTKTQKVWCFVFSILSVLGVVYGFEEAIYGHEVWLVFFKVWFICSIPLILQLIYLKIFGTNEDG